MIDASHDCLSLTFICQGEMVDERRRPTLYIIASRGVRQVASKEVIAEVESFATFWNQQVVDVFTNESYQTHRLIGDEQFERTPRPFEFLTDRFTNRLPIDSASYLESLSTATWRQHSDFPAWYLCHSDDVQMDRKSNARTNPFPASSASYNLVPKREKEAPKVTVKCEDSESTTAILATSKSVPNDQLQHSTPVDLSSKPQPAPEADTYYRHRSSTFGSVTVEPKTNSLSLAQKTQKLIDSLTKSGPRVLDFDIPSSQPGVPDAKLIEKKAEGIRMMSSRARQQPVQQGTANSLSDQMVSSAAEGASSSHASS